MCIDAFFCRISKLKAKLPMQFQLYRSEWFRWVAVKHTDAKHRGCQFEPCTCYNVNAIGEEGNGKPPHKIHFPGEKLRALSVVTAMLDVEYATQQFKADKRTSFHRVFTMTDIYTIFITTEYKMKKQTHGSKMQEGLLKFNN